MQQNIEDEGLESSSSWERKRRSEEWNKQANEEWNRIRRNARDVNPVPFKEKFKEKIGQRAQHFRGYGRKVRSGSLSNIPADKALQAIDTLGDKVRKYQQGREPQLPEELSNVPQQGVVYVYGNQQPYAQTQPQYSGTPKTEMELRLRLIQQGWNPKQIEAYLKFLRKSRRGSEIKRAIQRVRPIAPTSAPQAVRPMGNGFTIPKNIWGTGSWNIPQQPRPQPRPVARPKLVKIVKIKPRPVIQPVSRPSIPYFGDHSSAYNFAFGDHRTAHENMISGKRRSQQRGTPYIDYIP